MSNRTTRILTIAVLLIALTAGMAHSASFTYAKYRKEIKAGVLIFPNGAGVYTARSTAPYVFHVLNQRTDIKPQGWDFTNPLAPSRVTQDAVARWASADGPALREGDPVNREMGCYWEVKISAGLAELSQFDVLYVGLPGKVMLDRSGREKLRKFTDAGGVLWIENCSDQGSMLGYFFAADQILFTSSGGPDWAAAPNRVHPLVHRPHDLAWDEITRLGTDTNELRGTSVYRVGRRLVSFSAGGDKYFTTVIAVRGDINKPIVAGSQYGSGHVVASAENIGQAVSAFGSTYTDTGSKFIRNGTYCPSDRASLAPTEDVKAAINIVSWGSEHTTFHKGPRHTGYSFDEITAPLALKWSFEEPKKLGLPTSSSPAILNDMVFYVDGQGILHAFDLSPAQDLDNDGQPDDGMRDYADGAPYDEVWGRSCGEPASSPTATYVVIGGGAYTPAVFVATLSGKINAYNALTGAPLIGNETIMKVEPYPNTIQVIPSPTYFEGTVYAGDGMGNLQATNLLAGYQWRWPLTNNPGMPPTLSSPTVGYFRNPITGSVDELVYMAAAGRPGSVNGCIYSFPVKIYNEVLTQVPGIPSQYRVRKYNQMAIKHDPSTFELHYTLNNGALQYIDDTAVTVIDPGTFNISTKIPTGASVVADYEVDPKNSVYAPVYRQRIDVKNRVQNSPEGFGVSSTPSASPNDTLYYATENGSFYAVIEDGWGITTKWRWYMKDPGPLAMFGGTMPVAVGSPAVGSDRVYFAVNGGSDSYILAFDADPVFRISVGGPIDPRRPVEVLQNDSMNPGREPVAVSGAAEGTDTSRRRVAFKVDYEKGRITIENFLDPLSASQNLIVRFFPPTDTPGPGSRVEQIHSAFPGAGDIRYDDSWNNLAWCLRISDGKGGSIRNIRSSPMLMGGILYFGGDDGRLHAVNVHRIDQMASHGALLAVDDDTHWVWPDPLSQPGGLGGPILSTVGGSQGNIAIASPSGLAVLYNALTLVADSHRVLEADASGQVVWSCDSTSSFTGTRLSGTPTPVYAATKTAFNRPAVARRVGTSNILVADTGNNRVVLIDRAGNALCEINDFTESATSGTKVLPPGSPLKLNAPTDAWVWTMPGATPGTMDYHFLIADTGNYRVVEILYWFDQAANRYRKDIVWATHTLEQGKRYRYVSARRYRVPTGNTETICVIDNFVPQSDTPETTGGAIVRIDDATGLIRTDGGVRRYVDNPDGGDGTIKIVNPTFFSREYKTAGHYIDVIGDSRGVYVAEFIAGPPDQLVSPPGFFGAQAYGKPLLVSHAQLLPSGNVLVTNKASNLQVGASGAQGEVFEITWDIAKKAWVKIWPPNGVEIGGGSYTLEQPSSAERLFQ